MITSVTVEIAASSVAVWGVLTDFARYPQWNPYTVAVSTTLEVGSPIDLTLPHPLWLLVDVWRFGQWLFGALYWLALGVFCRVLAAGGMTGVGLVSVLAAAAFVRGGPVAFGVRVAV